MEDKWSVKRLIRSIVLSRVYQLSSEHNATNYEKDPANRLLWRMERRRLDAEEIRDAMLVASGQLDLRAARRLGGDELSNKQFFGGRAMRRCSSDVERAQRLSADLARVRARGAAGVRHGRPEPDRRQARRDDRADAGLVSDEQSVRACSRRSKWRGACWPRTSLNPDDRIDWPIELRSGGCRRDSEQAAGDELHQRISQERLRRAGHKENPQLAAWTSLCQTLFATGQFRYVY